MQRFSVRIEANYRRSGDVEQHPDGHFLFYTDAGRYRGMQMLLIETANSEGEAKEKYREKVADLLYWNGKKNRNLRPENGCCRLCGARREKCCC